MRIRNCWIKNVTAMVQLLSLILILSAIENMAQRSFLPSTHDGGHETPLHSEFNKNIQNPRDIFVPYPFHEVFSMIGREGEIQKIHYATDDNGVRANFYSNDVNSPFNYVAAGPQSSFVLPVEENVKKPQNPPAVNSPFYYVPTGPQSSFLLPIEENLKKSLNSPTVNSEFNYFPTVPHSSNVLHAEGNGKKLEFVPANNPAILPYMFPLNYDMNLPFNNNNNQNKEFQRISSWLHPTAIKENLRFFENYDLKNKEIVQTQPLSPNSRGDPSVNVNTQDIYPKAANKETITPPIEEKQYSISNRVPNTKQNNHVSTDVFDNTKLENTIKRNAGELHQNAVMDLYRIPKQWQNSSQKYKEERLSQISNSKPKINLADIAKLTESMDINLVDISYLDLTPLFINNTSEKSYTISRKDESIKDEQYNISLLDTKSANLQNTRENNYSSTLDTAEVPEISQIPSSLNTSDLKKWYLKQLNSPSVSTVFDISNDNGRFYHYVLNMVQPETSVTRNKYFTTGNALLKLLDEAEIPYAREDITFTQTTKPENGEDTLKYDSIKDKNLSKSFIIKSDVGKKKQTNINKIVIVPNATPRSVFDKATFNSTIAKNLTQVEIKETENLTTKTVDDSQMFPNAILNKLFVTESIPETSISTTTEVFTTQTSPSTTTEATTTQNAGTTSIFIQEENTTKSFDLVDSSLASLKENVTGIKSDSLFITIKNGPLNMLMIPVNWLFSSTSNKNDTYKENGVSITNMNNANETEASTLDFLDSTTSPSLTTSNDNDDSDVTNSNLESNESITAEIPSTIVPPVSMTPAFTLINKDLDATTAEISTESSTTKSATTPSYDQIKTTVTLNDPPTTTSVARMNKFKEEMDALTISDKDKNNNQTSDTVRQTASSKADSNLDADSKKSILEGKILNMTNAMIILQVSDMKELISHINDLPINLISMIGNFNKGNKSQKKIIHTIAHNSIPEKLLNKDKNKTEISKEKTKADKLSLTSVRKQSSKRKKSSANRKNDLKKLEVPQLEYSLIHPLLLESGVKSIFNRPHDDVNGILELSDIFAADKPVDTFVQNTFYDAKGSTYKQPPTAYTQHQSSIYRNAFDDVSNKNKPEEKITKFDKNTMNSRTAESFHLVNDMINHYPLQYNHQQNGIFQANSFDKTVSDDKQSVPQLFNEIPSSFYSISNENSEVVELVERIDFDKNNFNENETDFVDTLRDNVYFDILRLNDTNSFNNNIPQYEILEYVPLDSFQNNLQRNLEISDSRNLESENPVIFLDEYGPTDSVKSNVQNNLEARDSRNVQSENSDIFLYGYANTPIDLVRSERQSKIENSGTRNVQRENQVIFLDEYANGPTDSVRRNAHRNLKSSDSRNLQSENPVIILKDYVNTPNTRQQNTINTLTAELINSENQFSNFNEEPNILIVEDTSFGIRLQENSSPENPANEETIKPHLNVHTTDERGSSSILSRAPWLK